MAAIPESARHLFHGRDFAHLATLNTDGSPQTSPVWVGLDGDLVVVNTVAGLVKTRNLVRDSRVAVSIAGRANPYESLQIQGTVVEISAEGADESIDELARRYLGLSQFPYRQPGEERLIVKIEASRVNHRDAPDLSTSAVLQLHRDQVTHLLDKNMPAWVDTFADDAVFELPFAPAGYPARLDGKEAIRDYVKDYTSYIDLHGFSELVVHDCTDPHRLVVEASAEGRVVATGSPYRLRYVWVYTEADGKIVYQRDYWNPIAASEALGGDAEIRNAFGVNG